MKRLILLATLLLVACAAPGNADGAPVMPERAVTLAGASERLEPWLNLECVTTSYDDGHWPFWGWWNDASMEPHAHVRVHIVEDHGGEHGRVERWLWCNRAGECVLRTLEWRDEQACANPVYGYAQHVEAGYRYEHVGVLCELSE
jgi:hypothetical protein